MRVRRAKEADAEELALLCSDVFRCTYGHVIPPHTLNSYLRRAFFTDALQQSLASPSNHFWVAEQNETLSGVCKLAVVDAPPCVQASRPIELVNLYVGAIHQQHGIGTALMAAALALLAASVHDVLWLCVWEQNMNAIRFYQRWGFQQVGWHNIWVDDVCFRDLVMVREIS
ncbi:MAG: GNAT family N-acetyltransferase [Caldilineaceae bacterium]